MLNTRRNGWYDVLGILLRAYELRSERSFRTSRRATRITASKSATFTTVLTIDLDREPVQINPLGVQRLNTAPVEADGMRLPGKKTALYGAAFVLFLVVFAYLLLTYTRRVDGTSMYPTLKGGDLVVIQPVSTNDVHIGDIIVYSPPCSDEEFSVIHRVVGVTPDGGFLTQGDNNPLPDQYSGIAGTPINQACLVGKVVFVVPYVETLASLPYGVNYLLAFLIFLVIIVSEFWRRQAPERGQSDANTENLAPSYILFN